PSHYTAQVFGGAEQVLYKGSNSVGGKNVAVALKVLGDYGIKIIRNETGGSKGVNITFHTSENKVLHEVIRHDPKKDKVELDIKTPKMPDAAILKKSDTSKRALKVLIVDDSALIRKILRKAIEASPEFILCGEAKDAYDARDLLVTMAPDVMLLDIIMPKMNGIEFLKKVTEFFPTPVVILSTIAKEGSKIALEAKEAGATEVLDKEELKLYEGMETIKNVLFPILRSAFIKGPKR
ncbi:MAG: response regulator, partial [Planctomycetes bacterium]|nr:response regulator [Planctomycetota bacterium]